MCTCTEAGGRESIVEQPGRVPPVTASYSPTQDREDAGPSQAVKAVLESPLPNKWIEDRVISLEEGREEGEAVLPWLVRRGVVVDCWAGMVDFHS